MESTKFDNQSTNHLARVRELARQPWAVSSAHRPESSRIRDGPTVLFSGRLRYIWTSGYMEAAQVSGVPVMPSPDTAQAADTGRILLQFFLVTIVGGFLTYLFQLSRDYTSKREAVRAAKLQLITEIDELYRSSKQVKRMIRSRMRGESDERSIKSGFFENQMDALSRIQLSLEQSCQTIRAISDLFGQPRQKRILYELRYTESYLHDVVEEFEKRCVLLSDGSYKLTQNCPMLKISLVQGGFRKLLSRISRSWTTERQPKSGMMRYDVSSPQRAP